MTRNWDGVLSAFVASIVACVIDYAKLEAAAVAPAYVEIGEKLRARTEFTGTTEMDVDRLRRR